MKTEIRIELESYFSTYLNNKLLISYLRLIKYLINVKIH